jgi:hypothetical protein
MSLDQAIDQIQECVDSAFKVHQDVQETPGTIRDDEEQARLHWLERQLLALIVQLQALITDLESGLSLRDVGYADEQELDEMLEDIDCQIHQLERLIREAKGLGR